MRISIILLCTKIIFMLFQINQKIFEKYHNSIKQDNKITNLDLQLLLSLSLLIIKLKEKK
jgi:hypothetical protein